MKGQGIIFLLMAASFVVLTFIGALYAGKTDSFLGIADAREVVISHSESVEIRNIFVSEGSLVSSGENLLELINVDLSLRLNQVFHELSRIEAQSATDKKEISARIVRLIAERDSAVNAIDLKIEQLSRQFEFNRKLTGGLKSISGKDVEKTLHKDNPFLIQIEGLKKERDFVLRGKNVEIAMLRNILSEDKDPLRIQAEKLENELNVIQDAAKNLEIISPLDGLIGSVFFKIGEKVPPFAPIMTVHTRNPQLIKGFVPESYRSNVTIGSPVIIVSSFNPEKTMKGRVAATGSRIVEVPERLRPLPNVPLWGTEVMIAINEDNDFVLGEKVMITIDENKVFRDKLVEFLPFFRR